jgi:hypothetical protein
LVTPTWPPLITRMSHSVCSHCVWTGCVLVDHWRRSEAIIFKKICRSSMSDYESRIRRGRSFDFPRVKLINLTISFDFIDRSKSAEKPTRMREFRSSCRTMEQ